MAVSTFRGHGQGRVSYAIDKYCEAARRVLMGSAYD